jgi:hypothetical protein
MLQLPPRNRCDAAAPCNHGAPRHSHVPSATHGCLSRAGRNHAGCGLRAQSGGIPRPRCDAQIGGEIARAIPLGRRPMGARGAASVPDTAQDPATHDRPDRFPPPHRLCCRQTRGRPRRCRNAEHGPPHAAGAAAVAARAFRRRPKVLTPRPVKWAKGNCRADFLWRVAK